MFRLPLLLTLSLSCLVVGCVSNPTPHPGNEDGQTTFVDTSAGAESTARTVCDLLGGQWSADEHACEIDLGDDAFANATDGDSTPPASDVRPRADVVAVDVSGDPGAYDFAVTIDSADTGCEGYADWWEVVRMDASLAYRRILAHSHVDEQPFSRSGGPVDVSADELVLVRAHRHPEGYVGDAMIGRVSDGFTTVRIDDALDGLADEAPQPSGCAY